jgi:hypothetical protein
MKKDLIAPPMLPYTSEEEADLVAKLGALTEPALNQYVESAQNALGNHALAPSWRPRVELGLKVAQEALARAGTAAAQPPVVAA